jgi:hypothetical protein
MVGHCNTPCMTSIQKYTGLTPACRPIILFVDHTCHSNYEMLHHKLNNEIQRGEIKITHKK